MHRIHIAGEPYHYCGWPAIAAAGNGTLIVSYCRAEEHIAPDGKIYVVRSIDGGQSWSSPVVVRDSIIDDRECGLTRLANGRILLHCWSTHHTLKSYGSLDEFSYEPDVIEHWLRHVASSEYANAANEHGSRIYITEDTGITWKAAGPGPDTIHGGIQLESGEILVAGYRTDSPNIGIYRAEPTSFEWERIALFAPPATETKRFGEPHVAQLPSGRVLMMLRSTAVPYNDESDDNYLWMTYSDDGGATWAPAVQTGLWGFPPHLLVLSDGRVVCTYGHRRAPYGQRACISDHGMTWDVRREVVLRDDADNIDLGYPATIEISPGRLLTVYYQAPHCDPPPRMRPPDPLRHKPDIMGTFWEVDRLA